MRLVVDARSLELRWAGIARYIIGVVRTLESQRPDLQIEFLSRKPIPQLDSIFEGRVRNVHEMNPAFRMLKTLVWYKLRGARIANMRESSHFWGAAGLLPFALRQRSAITIHDVNHLIAPTTMGIGTRIAYSMSMRSDAQKTDTIFANSFGTASRLKDLMGINVDGVVHPEMRNELILAIPEKPTSLPFEKFFFCLGTNEPRKQLDVAINAFVDLKKRGCIEGHGLVIAGDVGWKNAASRSLIKQSESLGVIHIGYATDAHIAWLFKNCSAFLFPSLYEGYGMPVQEATCLGARVVCTDIPELREAGGERSIHVSPTVDGMAAGILQALEMDLPSPCAPPFCLPEEVQKFADKFLRAD